MFALERQNAIVDRLKEQGAVSVSRLSTELGVTEETIRRDLEKLEKKEILLRTHGGAVPVEGNNYELSLEKRKSTNIEAKERLAKEAARLVATGDAIFIDASTTAFYLAKELKNFKNITVVTNSLRVLNELCSNPDIRLIGVGGMMSSNLSLVGSIAEKNIRENYFVNKMFFSSRGMTINGGILESNEQECYIKQAMMEKATEKYYICDKTKVGRVGFVKLAEFEEITGIITEENALDEEFSLKLSELKVSVKTI